MPTPAEIQALIDLYHLRPNRVPQGGLDPRNFLIRRPPPIPRPPAPVPPFVMPPPRVVSPIMTGPPPGTGPALPNLPQPVMPVPPPLPTFRTPPFIVPPSPAPHVPVVPPTSFMRGPPPYFSNPVGGINMPPPSAAPPTMPRLPTNPPVHRFTPLTPRTGIGAGVQGLLNAVALAQLVHESRRFETAGPNVQGRRLDPLVTDFQNTVIFFRTRATPILNHAIRLVQHLTGQADMPGPAQDSQVPLAQNPPPDPVTLLPKLPH